MFLSRVSIALAFAGLALVVFGGPFWPGTAVGRRLWSEEDAKRLSLAVGQRHATAHQLAHAQESGDRAAIAQAAADYERAEAEFQALEARLETAQRGGQNAAAAIKWLGLACGAASAVFWMIARTRLARDEV